MEALNYCVANEQLVAWYADCLSNNTLPLSDVEIEAASRSLNRPIVVVEYPETQESIWEPTIKVFGVGSPQGNEANQQLWNSGVRDKEPLCFQRKGNHFQPLVPKKN